MAICFPPARTHRPETSAVLPYFRFFPASYSTNHALPAAASISVSRSSPFIERRYPTLVPGRCRATTPGPASPPESEPPPPGKEPSSSSGLSPTLSRVQETVQIFAAVFFWMSLFFWASVWDRGSDIGRPDKRSRFRK